MSQSHFETFNYALMIKEHHLDTFGHVNNATYLQLLEEARWEIVGSRGFSLESIHEKKIGPVILEITIKFIKELGLRQMIHIESKIIALEGKVTRMKQTIFNEQGELCTEAFILFGLFDTEKRKLIAPTEEWLHAIGRRI